MTCLLYSSCHQRFLGSGWFNDIPIFSKAHEVHHTASGACALLQCTWVLKTLRLSVQHHNLFANASEC